MQNFIAIRDQTARCWCLKKRKSKNCFLSVAMKLCAKPCTCVEGCGKLRAKFTLHKFSIKLMHTSRRVQGESVRTCTHFHAILFFHFYILGEKMSSFLKVEFETRKAWKKRRMRSRVKYHKKIFWCGFASILIVAMLVEWVFYLS